MVVIILPFKISPSKGVFLPFDKKLFGCISHSSVGSNIVRSATFLGSMLPISRFKNLAGAIVNFSIKRGMGIFVVSVNDISDG